MGDDTSVTTKPEDWFNPLFKAILYSVSWVRKLINPCILLHTCSSFCVCLFLSSSFVVVVVVGGGRGGGGEVMSVWLVCK